MKRDPGGLSCRVIPMVPAVADQWIWPVKATEYAIDKPASEAERRIEEPLA